jgi:HAD superfamily hydrolase (TIGR01509 family)
MSLSPLARLLGSKRLLLFDLDGTLVDSSPLHARAFEDTFAGTGVPVDYATIAGLVTEDAVDKLFADAGRDADAGKRKALVVDKRRRAADLIATELQAMPGATEFVRRARARFRIALCTSASRAGAELALDKTGLDGMFEIVLTAEDVRIGKPDPEMFLKAVTLAEVSPADALVFEDAPSGLAAAAAAGIDAIRIVPVREPGGEDWTVMLAALKELGG